MLLAGLLSNTQTFQNLTVGSDDELGLRKALKHSFCNASSVVCSRRLKLNTQDYLANKVGANVTERNQIVNSIFGDDGLTSITNVNVFYERVNSLIADFFQTVGAQFASYFSSRLVKLLRSNLIAGHSRWTTSNSESINHVLKMATK
jgi:hypothetical protein